MDSTGLHFHKPYSARIVGRWFSNSRSRFCGRQKHTFLELSNYSIAGKIFKNANFQLTLPEVLSQRAWAEPWSSESCPAPKGNLPCQSHNHTLRSVGPVISDRFPGGGRPPSQKGREIDQSGPRGALALLALLLHQWCQWNRAGAGQNLEEIAWWCFPGRAGHLALEPLPTRENSDSQVKPKILGIPCSPRILPENHPNIKLVEAVNCTILQMMLWFYGRVL